MLRIFQLLMLTGATVINIRDTSASPRRNARVSDLEERVTCLENTLEAIIEEHSAHQRGIDCSDVQSQLGHASGVYSLWRGDDMPPFDVVCLKDEQGPWTLIQRRVNGDVNFLRNWTEYRNGFGDLGFSSNFWLGLEKIHQVTSLRPYMLRIDLKDWDGQTAYAEYANFYLDDEDQDYAIHSGTHSGSAGDSLNRLNGLRFSTTDRDNDHNVDDNCGTKGGWWHLKCGRSNLNGIYRTPPEHTGHGNDGIQWFGFKSAWYSMKQSTMRIRPIMTNRNDLSQTTGQK